MTWNEDCPVCSAHIDGEMPPLEIRLRGDTAWIRTCGAGCATTLSADPSRYIPDQGARMSRWRLRTAATGGRTMVGR
ncbi:MAG: hypothetical protein H0V44_17400 [Planctomycetes bacterium]|nr:hypothetical protein [Planctomycetota bacterium]